MALTANEYKKISDLKSPKSNIWINMLKAFLFGGAICTVGQVLTNVYIMLGMDKEVAGSVTSVSLIFLGALLTGLNVYDKIAKHGGAGTLVPITGFSNSIVAPALEFKSEGYILGLGAKMFIIAGPVLVYGITSSIIYGMLIFIFGLF